jgi:hypothetical protein
MVPLAEDVDLAGALVVAIVRQNGDTLELRLPEHAVFVLGKGLAFQAK